MPERFIFSDLRELFAKANEEKSGDQLAGLAARSERERVAAKVALADLPLATLLDEPLVDDAVTDALLGVHDRARFDDAFGGLVVGELRERVLDPAFAA